MYVADTFFTILNDEILGRMCVLNGINKISAYA